MGYPADFAGHLRAAAKAVLAWTVRKKWRKACRHCEGSGLVDKTASGGVYAWAPGMAPKGKLYDCELCEGKGTTENRPFGEECMNLVGEVAELNEAARDNALKSPDEKCPAFTKAEIEAADVLIRLLDMAGFHGWRLGEAYEAKMAYNETRPDRHGGKAH